MAAAAERQGHEVTTADLCFADSPRSVITEAVRAFDPQVVGISLRNLDSSTYPESYSYVEDYRALVDTIREECNAAIVLGGSGFTVMPVRLLEILAADVGIAGEGEAAFPWVLERIGAGEILKSTPQFRCEPVNGGVCVTPLGRIAPLDSTGVPTRRRFDTTAYYERGGALNVQTKRGCHFHCVFCSYPVIEGTTVRLRSAAAVADEIQEARREFGVRHWFIVDNIFNVPIDHAKAVCEELIARGLDIEWSAYLNPRLVDEDLCRLMARSGCKGIEFGADSGSRPMMVNLKKDFDPGDLRRTSALCHEHGLKFCHSLVFGGPGETRDTVTETIDLMDELRPTAVIAMTGIRILPGTEMVQIALRDGQIEPHDDLLYPRFYISPALEDGLIECIEQHARRRSNWIVPGRGIKTNVEVLRKLRERRIKGQLWRLLR